MCQAGRKGRKLAVDAMDKTFPASPDKQ